MSPHATVVAKPEPQRTVIKRSERLRGPGETAPIQGGRNYHLEPTGALSEWWIEHRWSGGGGGDSGSANTEGEAGRKLTGDLANDQDHFRPHLATATG